MFRKIFDFSIVILMLLQMFGQPVVSGGYNDAVQMKGNKPDSGVNSDQSLKNVVSPAEEKVSAVNPVSNGIADEAPQEGSVFISFSEEDGYWPFKVLPSACHAGKEKECYTAYNLVGMEIGKGKICLQKDFSPTAIASGWTTNKDVCKRTTNNGEESVDNETSGNNLNSTEYFTQKVEDSTCLEGNLLLLTKPEENELMLVNLDTFEKNVITENSPGKFLDGAFGEGVCPLIMASQIADGLKVPDLVQIRIRLGAFNPEILRWTFTPAYWENLVQADKDGGVYYTRGKASPSIYYLEGKGSEPQLIVEDGADSDFADTLQGDDILAYEVSSGNIAYRFNNEPPVTLINAELATGENPVVHPSGSIVFISEGELVYTYGTASKSLASTGIVATDLAFSSNGKNVVIITDGEAWLYTVQINQSEMIFTKKLQITQLDVDGVVSHPDLLQ